MTNDRLNPRELSQRELDTYLDDLVTRGQEDTPEFQRAYEAWEENQ